MKKFEIIFKNNLLILNLYFIFLHIFFYFVFPLYYLSIAFSIKIFPNQT